jgi:hypothetical protein
VLRRVVIDECHVAITADSWRTTLRRLKDVRLLPCQQVLLSQGGNSSQPSLEFLPWDQKYRVLRSSIPGRQRHSALSGGWLGTRYTHLLMYISSHTLGGLNFKVSVEVGS